MTSSVAVRARAALAILSFAAVPVSAQLNRTAVSIAGNDVNSCAPATPCRSFARAMSQTNASGEIIVLDSAGYGPFTIDRSVTIQAAPGVYAGVTASSGNGVTLSLPASGKAVIRGLTLEGLGTGTAGIYGFAGVVHIENCIVNGFVSGIVVGGYTVTISDSEIRNNTTQGIIVANAGNRAVLEHLRIKNNGNFGLVVQDSARATIRNSVITGHTAAGLSATFNAVLNVENTEATQNFTGIFADSGATTRVSNTFVTDNSSTGLRNDKGTMESWQNNKVRGNTTDFGSGSGGVLTNLSQQ